MPSAERYLAPVTRFSGLARRAALVGLLLGIEGCAPGRDLPPLPEDHTASYVLGAGDQLRIITYGEEQLSSTFTISATGEVSMPLVGSIQAAGLSPSELGAAIADRLRQRQVLQHPSVSVDVMTYRPIFVLGEVAKPGQYPYQPGMTMLTAVAVAGGFTYRAVEDYASDVRTVTGQPVIGKITPQSFVQPGDVVNILERRF